MTSAQQKTVDALRRAIERYVQDELPAGYALLDWKPENVTDTNPNTFKRQPFVSVYARVDKPEKNTAGGRWWHVLVGPRGACITYEYVKGKVNGKRITGLLNCVSAYRWCYF